MLISQLRTSKRLGWRNCAAVGAHRLALHTGFYAQQLPRATCPIPDTINWQAEPQPLTSASETSSICKALCLEAADALLNGRATWFNHESHPVCSPPDWFFDPASGQRFPDAQKHWSRCRLFTGVDIKRCWELSRWGWAPLLARAWRFSGDNRYREGLNNWSQSWCNANPVNAGSNWLCGQEVSIRILHALQAWKLTDCPAKLPFTTRQRAGFIKAHLQRISATERYAEAQDNNHWTSEAAALFIGGNWLAASDSDYAEFGENCARQGRHALERSLVRLVMPDGSFAQHSLTYHRLLLDTIAQVELWRIWLDLPRFSECLQARLRAATHWLSLLVDPLSGDGPNLGSNDGAFCYQLHNQPYRDFRPTVQLASVLFLGGPLLSEGPWDEPCHWLGLNISPSSQLKAAFSNFALLSDGGYALLRPIASSWGLLRLPTYRFRPAHADPLHLDLWHQGVNILRDGGTNAYNASEADLTYFPGIASHNSVEFDGVEPMPRLGRFLWGDWLQLEAPPQVDQGAASTSITASYRCLHGRHQRKVQVDSTGLQWTVTDQCSAFQVSMVLRWRLAPGDWQVQRLTSAAVLHGSQASLSITSTIPLKRFELLNGWESSHYARKTSLPVLEVELAATSSLVVITTQIELKPS